MPAYPESWPLPDPDRPLLLHSRISDEQKEALYHRRISTRQLAEELKVHEKYLSNRFPGKVTLIDRRLKVQAKREYRMAIAKEVLEGKHTIKKAASMVHCSWNTMFRYVKKSKDLYPHLVESYNAIVEHRRKNPND